MSHPPFIRKYKPCLTFDHFNSTRHSRCRRRRFPLPSSNSTSQPNTRTDSHRHRLQRLVLLAVVGILVVEEGMDLADIGLAVEGIGLVVEGKGLAVGTASLVVVDSSHLGGHMSVEVAGADYYNNLGSTS